MKRLTLVLAVFLILIGTTAFAQFRISTDRLTSDQIVYTVPSGRIAGLCGVFVEADGTNQATCAVYDNTAGSGKMFPKVIVAAGEFYGGWQKSTCVEVKTGLYLDITGTNAACWIEYVRP